jgi:hypothetical protein
MLLSDLASLGSLISSIAVLASLIFLYLQVRQIGTQIEQTERNQRASIRAERASRSLGVMNALLEPSAADAVSLGNAASEEMSETQIRQFGAYCQSRFTNAEDAFDQHVEGLLGDTAFHSMIATFKVALSNPGFRVAWQIQRVAFRGDFVAFVDNLLAETSVVVRTDLVARFKAGFAAEKAKVLA